MADHKSPTKNLDLRIDGPIAKVVMNNPPAHVWNLESLRGMRDIVQELNQDKEILALILTGDGEKFFCAGADLKMFSDGKKESAQEVATAFGECMEALSQFEGVSIAAINGYAMGGGLEAALACDFRIAEQHAVMALPEAKVGLLPCGAGTQTLWWTVGEAWAKRMILMGEQIDSKTALQIGLISEIVEPGTIHGASMEFAKKVTQQSPTSVRACKKLIQKTRLQVPYSFLKDERQAFVDLFGTEDQKEGVAAFLEKRTPQWKNS